MMDNWERMPGTKLEISGSRATALHGVMLQCDCNNDQWGGPAHDDEHTEQDWIIFIKKQLGCTAFFGPVPNIVAFRWVLTEICALSLQGIEWCDRRMH